MGPRVSTHTHSCRGGRPSSSQLARVGRQIRSFVAAERLYEHKVCSKSCFPEESTLCRSASVFPRLLHAPHQSSSTAVRMRVAARGPKAARPCFSIIRHVTSPAAIPHSASRKCVEEYAVLSGDVYLPREDISARYRNAKSPI